MGLAQEDWKTDVYKAQPGSIADHMLYTMIELLGPVQRVSVQALHRAAEIEIADTVSAVLRFADGTSGALTAIGVTSTFERLHLFGTKGWAEVRNNTRFEIRPLEGACETIDFPPFDALRQEFEVFAAAASGEMPFPVTPENAVAGVAALEAIARSGLTGQPVTL